MRRVATVFSYKEPRFTPSQLRTMADIGVAVGQLFFAFVVFPFVIPALDKEKLSMVVFGVSLGLLVWVVSILISRRAL